MMVHIWEEGGDGAYLGRREVMVHIWGGGR